jgi:hypothetical protein
MGWNSANEIFDPVIGALRGADVPAATLKHVAVTLIKALQDGDWDTEDESLEEFKDDPVIVAAFAECGILPWLED